MKNLSYRGRMKTLKAFHLIFVMMWVTGVIRMGVLYWRIPDNSMEFLNNRQAALFADYVLVIPGAILTVLTGIIYGLKTKWGFFKFRWLTVKWIVGIAIVLIGTFGLYPLELEIIAEAEPAANEAIAFPSDYFGAKLNIVNCMTLLQALALIFLVVISELKPWSKRIAKSKD